jgi:fructose-1,6-bisphosphatase/inositol monophosphatase family enzyme
MEQRKFLTALVQEAGTVIKQRFSQSVAYSEKSRFHLVSEVDLEVEERVVSRLARAYPDDGIFSEEGGLRQGGNHRLWIVDPLDGTANFLFGVPHFAVSIALEEEGRIVLGAVFDPISDELFFSEGGGVSYLNDQRITCSDRDHLPDCLVAFGVSMIPANLRRMIDEWPELLACQKKGLALLAPALNICHVACGRTDVFIDFGSEMEGHAAGAFILQNAGGAVSNYNFTPWDHRSKGIIASNGKLHEALSRIAHRVRPWKGNSPCAQ